MTDLREAATLVEMSSMNSPLKLIALLTLATMAGAATASAQAATDRHEPTARAKR
jgi:hypothetical protein